MRFHIGKHCSNEADGAEERECVSGIPTFVIRIVKSSRTWTSRICHEDLDWTEIVPSPINHVTNIWRPGQIHFISAYLDILVFTLQMRSRLFKHFTIPITDRDVTPFPCKSIRRRES